MPYTVYSKASFPPECVLSKRRKCVVEVWGHTTTWTGAHMSHDLDTDDGDDYDHDGDGEGDGDGPSLMVTDSCVA